MNKLITDYLTNGGPKILKRIQALHKKHFGKVIQKLPRSYIQDQNLDELEGEVLARFFEDRTIFAGRTAFELIVQREYPAEYFLYYSADSATRKVLAKIGKLVSDQFAKERNQYKHILTVLNADFAVFHRLEGHKYYGLIEWEQSGMRNPKRLSYTEVEKLAFEVVHLKTRYEQITAVLKTIDHPLMASQIAEILKRTTDSPLKLVPIVSSTEPDDSDVAGIPENVLPQKIEIDPLVEAATRAAGAVYGAALDRLDAHVMKIRYGDGLDPIPSVSFKKIADDLRSHNIAITGEALRIREQKILIRLKNELAKHAGEEQKLFLEAFLEKVRERSL